MKISLVYFLYFFMINKTYYPASRSNIDSFYVMDLLYNANKLEANGKKIFHLELGEPQPANHQKSIKGELQSWLN